MEELLAWKRQLIVVKASARCAPSLLTCMLGIVACWAFLIGSIFKELKLGDNDFSTSVYCLPREVLDDFED